MDVSDAGREEGYLGYREGDIMGWSGRVSKTRRQGEAGQGGRDTGERGAGRPAINTAHAPGRTLATPPHRRATPPATAQTLPAPRRPNTRCRCSAQGTQAPTLRTCTSSSISFTTTSPVITITIACTVAPLPAPPQERPPPLYHLPYQQQQQQQRRAPQPGGGVNSEVKGAGGETQPPLKAAGTPPPRGRTRARYSRPYHTRERGSPSPTTPGSYRL
ncbi:hypothetical protein Pcinc_028229 [Petrolisthes cinctipes]|uniref:Uncharacterized protein n=1 Tax=Petrolisthes cinctipes TaxID=88211 RepID=A0AAE1F3C2_PETCI|nr:hypothetical protein Pcinc_028229 [Petrolisthes cinctipes]